MASDKLGATGGFPRGKLNETDEGELQFTVGEEDGNVVIRFGSTVSWLGMPPEQAVAFAQVLITKARMIARRQGKTLAVTL